MIDHRRVVAYVRIGAGEQHPSVAKQDAAIRAHCTANGLTMVAMHSDVAAGAESFNRDGVRSAIATVRSGEAGTLLVYSMDRLTANVTDLSALLDGDFTRDGARLMAVHGDVDSRTASGRMSLRLMTAVVQCQCETADVP